MRLKDFRATRVRVADAKGLELFLDEYPDLTDGALLLYAGSEAYPLTPKGPGRILVAGDVGKRKVSGLPDSRGLKRIGSGGIAKYVLGDRGGL